MTKKNHRLSEVKAQQQALEDAITHLIQQFEAETGLEVNEVRVGRVRNATPAIQTISEDVTTARVVVIL